MLLASLAKLSHSMMMLLSVYFVLLVLIDRFNSEPFEEDMVFPTLSSRLLHEASFWLVVTFSLKPVGGVGYHITKYHYKSKGDEKPQPSPLLLSPTFINPMITMIAKVNLIL